MGRSFDFIANSQDGVFAVDRRQTTVLWNSAATTILGFDSEEVLGKKCYRVLRGRDSDGCVVCRGGCKAFSLAERLEFPASQRIAATTKTGDTAWLDLNTIVVPSRRKTLSVLVHMFREVTREHYLQRVVRDFAEIVSGLSSNRGTRLANDSVEPVERVELTRREQEILVLLATGVSTEQIADRLSISPRTVRNHVGSILNKLGVHSRLEAVTYSIQNGLV